MTDHEATPETLRATVPHLEMGNQYALADIGEKDDCISQAIGDVLAAADAWDEERTTRHMEAAKFLSQIAAWKGSCMAAEKRLEAAEKALRQIATMTNDMSADGQFTAGDAYYAQHLAVAALAGEET